ncbi:FadR/GntR family transcriptional regulator [Alsobacter sp. R-9]
MTQLSRGAVKDIVDRIGSDIVSGTIEQGAILPKEEELAASYGVGRSTLREAVKVLSGKGLVRTARRFGSQVCTSDEWNFLDPDVLGWYAAAPVNVPGLILSMIELRSAIEPAAAGLAAARANPREAAAIMRHAEALMASTRAVDPASAFEHDIAFHIGILQATHNVLFRGLSSSYEVLLRAQYRAAEPLVWGEARYRPDDKHILLADAIVARDPARATRVANDMMLVMRDTTEHMARQLGVEPDRVRSGGRRASPAAVAQRG